MREFALSFIRPALRQNIFVASVEIGLTSSSGLVLAVAPHNDIWFCLIGCFFARYA
jgi:hypothetical protein